MKTKFDIGSKVFGILDVNRDGEIRIIYGKVREINITEDRKTTYWIKSKDRTIILSESQVINGEQPNNFFVELDEMLRGN